MGGPLAGGRALLCACVDGAGVLMGTGHSRVCVDGTGHACSGAGHSHAHAWGALAGMGRAHTCVDSVGHAHGGQGVLWGGTRAD